MAALDPAIRRFYDRYEERERLTRGPFVLEWLRTQELLARYLPKPPARVIDVGGGPGAYACALATSGYEVTLVDPVPRHVEQAKAACGGRIARAEVGDARDLSAFADGAFDAALCLGPLYHLTSKEDRLKALAEVRRVVRPGGPVLAAAISRYASLLDGLVHRALAEPGFAEIVAQDLATGQHRNPEEKLDWFTTAYFHRADDLLYEACEAGLDVEKIVGIEGPGWLVGDLERRLADEAELEALLHAARAVEDAEEMVGVSAHLMMIGRRPS
ncbi:MAG TPA: methyltransferase domain-containing protein [Vicinamibacteria bacterium]|nr:methyltransferase domain-containing protein [Vicinamibacteria bacterium]